MCSCAGAAQVVVESGMAPASHLLELYNTRWGRNVDPLFEEFMY